MKNAQYWNEKTRRAIEEDSGLKTKKGRARLPQLAKLKWVEHINGLKLITENRVWTDFRSASDYDGTFLNLLNELLHNKKNTVAQHLIDLGGKKRKLTLFSDGIGDGLAETEFVSALRDVKIKASVDGITLHALPKAIAFQKAGLIEHIYEGSAETFLPKKKYDVILSHHGSISYTPVQFLKTHLLKYLYSLNREGVLLCVISPASKFERTPLNVSNILTEIAHLKRMLPQVEEKLKRMGFRCSYQLKTISDDLVLVVQRIK
jgi:hypothetical protein